MYYKYFGFEELPFSVTPDPRFFYSNAVYQDALAGLEQGIRPGNAFIVVTGEAGTGKTTLLHRLISSSSDSIEYTLLITPCLDFIALLRSILKNRGLPDSSTDRRTLLEQLHSHVYEQFTKGRTVAVLFDEAQDLSDEVLEELRLLCGIDNGAVTMPIVLMGQPELDSRIDASKLRRVKECITLRRRLGPLQDHEVYPYLTLRLEHAGYHGNQLFEPAAIETLINKSSGIPRLINNICDNALLLAYRASEHRVTAAMIDEVANQLLLIGSPLRRNPLMRLPITYDATPALPIPERQNDEFTSQTRFPEQSSSAAPGRAETLEESLPEESADVSRTADDIDREDRRGLTPSLTDDFDEPGRVDRYPSQNQTTVSEKLPPLGSGAGDINDGDGREDRDQVSASVDQPNIVSKRNHPFAKVGKLEISIGAAMVLIMLAWGWIEFYPRRREGALPAVTGHGASIPGDAQLVTLSEKPISVTQRAVKEIPQPLLLTSPPHPAPVRKEPEQKSAGAPEEQAIAEVTNAGTRDQPPDQEIYRVSGASFVRNRPTADAEIIDTLQPGTRIAVTKKAGEYFRVRSLSDEKVSGFVHREDAFFERIQ